MSANFVTVAVVELLSLATQVVHILQIVSGRELNGAVVHCDLLARRLADRGHRVTLLCRPNSWIQQRTTNPRIAQLCSTLTRWPLDEVWRVADFIRQEKVHVIHTHMSSAHTFGLLLRWQTGIPCVATAHSHFIQLHWRMNNAVIANSEYTKKFHCRYNLVDPAKITTIPCFVDQQRILAADSATRMATRREFGFDENDKIVGIIGDVIRRKGQKYLFAALPRLIERYPTLHVWVIGRYDRTEPYTRQLRRLLHRLKIYRRVHWLFRREDVPRLLRAMDVCVIPSLVELQGLVALEAMAAGTPVVASRCGGLPELVRHGETGRIVPPRDANAIAGAIQQTFEDQQTTGAMVERARKIARERYSPQLLTDRVEAVLTAAVCEAKARREALQAKRQRRKCA